jgi:hypothetical protein
MTIIDYASFQDEIRRRDEDIAMLRDSLELAILLFQGYSHGVPAPVPSSGEWIAQARAVLAATRPQP